MEKWARQCGHPTLPSIRRTPRRASSSGSEFPEHPDSLAVPPTFSVRISAQRTASQERPRTQPTTCGTTTQSKPSFFQATAPDPSGSVLFDLTHTVPWLSLVVPRGSGHAHLGKVHRALVICKRTTPWPTPPSPTVAKHDTVAGHTAPTPSGSLSLERWPTSTHHHTTCHHEHPPDFVAGMAQAPQQHQALFHKWDQHLIG